MVSCAAAGPTLITTTSPAPAFSFRRSASSMANSSYGFMTNFTPDSSRLFPSAAIFTRVSESGTRLIQQAIFMGGKAKLAVPRSEHGDAPRDWIIGGIVVEARVRVGAVGGVAHDVGSRW